MWVEKRAMSVFNPFCSNVARKVAFFIVVRFTLLYDLLENDTFLNLLEPLTTFDTRDLQIHP